MSTPTSGRPIRWGLAASAAAILFALLFISGRLLFDVSGQAVECRNGTVVPDPTTNTGLVADCDVLWGLKDTLLGTATLNWNATTAVEDWEGIRLSTEEDPPRTGPPRVTGIILYALGGPGIDPATQKLNGRLPAELANLSELRSLTITDHELTGSIPKELGNLSNLEYLIVAQNMLTGSIPKELGNLSNLLELYLRNNMLTGGIPKELGNLSKLEWMSLADNMLTGPIPSELGGISTLERLKLGNNRLSGEFPLWVKNLNSLKQFSIQRNLLTGHLPLDYPFPAGLDSPPRGHAQIGRIDSDPPGDPTRLIGCIPSWASSTLAVDGEANLPLPTCGSPPSTSVWLLDTVLVLPSPFLSATSTEMTLRATYTIPKEYIDENPTQFHSLSARVATGRSMTVEIARRATSTSPQLAGFDTRPSGATGVPVASDLAASTTINSNAFSCSSVAGTEGLEGTITPGSV